MPPTFRTDRHRYADGFDVPVRPGEQRHRAPTKASSKRSRRSLGSALGAQAIAPPFAVLSFSASAPNGSSPSLRIAGGDARESTEPEPPGRDTVRPGHGWRACHGPWV